MLLRPTTTDVRVIVHTTGQALTAVGLGTSFLAFVALLVGDVNSGTALTIGGAVGLLTGWLAREETPVRSPLSWTRGMVAAVTSWVSCALVAAIPFYLSGHYASYLDATFEAMSGLTTTGLTLVQDLDHLPVPLAWYRHALELTGGIAAVVVGLALLTAPTATASSMRPSDVRDERILPSPQRMWRRVGTIGAWVVGAGAVASTLAVAIAGVGGWRAVGHGIALATSAAATGGFAPTSASVTYYHSATVEFVLVPVMLAGAVSFAIHTMGWRGRGRSLWREIELRTFVMTLTLTMVAVMIGLGRAGSHGDVLPLFRRGVFTVVSAHTTSGLQTVPARLIAVDWGLLAPAALVAAMAIGGMTGSTSGGLKVFRVGVLLKGLVADVRRVLLPDSALVVSTYVQDRRRILSDAHVRSAATMLLIVLTAILTAAVAILFIDGSVDLTNAVFLATSAASNAGMSLGVFTAESADALKVGFLALMLLGRLEWMAVFATAGFAFAGLRGRR